VSWFVTIIFCNVASVSKIELIGDRAKRLRLGIFGELEFAALELSLL
jgi:hypothetical protein